MVNLYLKNMNKFWFRVVNIKLLLLFNKNVYPVFNEIGSCVYIKHNLFRYVERKRIKT